MGASQPLSATPRIVVRGVNWLGDVVMTLPALQRLRERFPGARITLLTAAKLADLYAGQPGWDDVWSFRKEEGPWAIGRRLRAGRFDLAVILPNSPRSALEAWLGRVPRRVGGAWPWRNRLLTDVVPADPHRIPTRARSQDEIRAVTQPGRNAPPFWGLPDPGVESHQIHHYLRLVAHLGGDPTPVAPRLVVSAAAAAAVRDKFGLGAERAWLGLNAGAEFGPAKRWPAEHFVAVGREVVRWPGWGVALFGGPGDVEAARALAAGIEAGRGDDSGPVQVLAGRTSLAELGPALSVCRVVVTNDTGPMHVAAAVGVPVVVPFGSTSPGLTGPGLPGDSRHVLLRAGAPCSPCFLRECPVDFRCLRGITPTQVLQALGRIPNSEF